MIPKVVAKVPGGIDRAVDKSTRPNVLLIMAQDHGKGDLSGYGGKDVKTPHLDGLMAEGIGFSSFYANCCVCSPTRAALLSGRYPELVGIPGVVRSYWSGNFGFLTPESIMLPSFIRRKP
jgi:arylsulfatase A-like enzyme